MKKIILLTNILILLALGLSACAAPTATVEPVIKTENTDAETETKLDRSGSDLPDEELPFWFSQELKDINSGTFFKITDFEGKVILVETMAVWCPKCLTQQQEIAKLKTVLAAQDDFVSIGIDIDPNENEGLLASHVEKYGFDWIFTIASKPVIDEIGSLYGAQFLNPPATPMLIIDRQGAQHPLPFGIKSAEELQKALQPFLDAE